MNPIFVAVGAGLGLALLYTVLFGKPNRFLMQGETRFWTPESVPDLTALLNSSTAVPHASVERVWQIVAGKSAAAGTVPALQLVRGIRTRSGVAMSSTNLLDASAPVRLISELSPQEFSVLKNMGTEAQGQAVLPTL